MRGSNVTEGMPLSGLLDEALAAGLPRLDAELLVAGAAGVSRALLIARGAELRLATSSIEAFRSRVARRAAGEPLAYIQGLREFWSLEIEVTPEVLIPRPETELLVETTLERLAPTPQRVADLGTGSGAVALALAHERAQWDVLATDVSPTALAVARRNAARLGLTRVRFAQGSWVDALRGEAPFDALVSNPPYVAEGDPALPALAWEPRGALVSPDQGFADLLALVRDAPSFLRSGGWLMLEHGATQAARLGAALVTRGFTRVRCHPDLAGRDRVTVAQWP